MHTVIQHTIMKRFMVFCLSSVLTLSLAGQDLARLGMDDSDTPKGLLIGEAAPDFSGTTLDNEKLQLSVMLKEGPVVMFFYRGYWCPKCDRHLEAFADSLQMLTDIGLQVVAITPETVEGIERTVEQSGINFHVLSDPGGKIMADYDVDFKVTEDYSSRILKGKGVDIATSNGSDEAWLPVPATFIISTDQEIFWRHFNWNYGKRAGVRDILEAIKPKYR